VVISSLLSLSNSEACIGVELTGGVYERYPRFCKGRIPCLVFREATKAADARENGNKYTARVICLQDLCQLQDTVLPLLFKGFDDSKLAKQKGEIWGNVANVSTETLFRVKFQKAGL